MSIRNLQQIISQELLPLIQQPGQYVGLEINALNPDVHNAQVTACIAFPDTYAIGMSHLGGQVLYHALNALDGVACDRSYCPLHDAEEIMRDKRIPLFGWESRCALADFDILGFSLAYEVCCTNVLTMLDLAGIPLHADQRTDEHPIIVAGDAMADSPEPMADFIDLFLVGDGEKPLCDLAELIRQAKQSGASRQEIILQAAKTIPGAYAPQFYVPRYNPDGTMAALERTRDDVPETIHHQYLPCLSDSPSINAPLVPLSEAVHDRVAIEVMRGCPNACRFCQAGELRLPVRYRKVEEILDIARKAIAATGYREISLLSLSTSDYPWLDELIEKLTAEFAPQNVSISLPSLRVDSQLQQLPKLTSTVRKAGLTIAAEAALPRMRRAIHKNISDEDMLAGVRAAYEAGWSKVKVYFMAGFPQETEQDIDGIYELCRKLSFTRKQVDGKKGSISASVSWLVPKPHTPMQWVGVRDTEYFFSVRHRLLDLTSRTPVNVKFHRIERSHLEAVLCRGDRRVGKAIEAAWRNGARMDAWNEHFNWDRWAEAFEQTQIDWKFYLREIPVDEVLPWSHIHCKRGPQWLKDQYLEMQRILSEES